MQLNHNCACSKGVATSFSARATEPLPAFSSQSSAKSLDGHICTYRVVLNACKTSHSRRGQSPAGINYSNYLVKSSTCATRQLHTCGTERHKARLLLDQFFSALLCPDRRGTMWRLISALPFLKRCRSILFFSCFSAKELKGLHR